MKEKFKIRLKEIIEEKNTNQDKYKNLRTLLELVLKDILDYEEKDLMVPGQLMGALRNEPYYYSQRLSIGNSIIHELNLAVHEDNSYRSDEQLKELLNKYCQFLSKLWNMKIDAPQIPKPFPTKETSKTVLSSELLHQAMNQYESLRENDFVVQPSLPVLFFGDIYKYLESDIKVVSVSLNPSNVEFVDGEGSEPSYFRFPDYVNTAESLEVSLSNYFKEQPYTRWFGEKKGSNTGFLPVLEGMGLSYYNVDSKQIAIHTDLCSPIATSPTWSKLKKHQQALLFDEGFKTWKKLIVEIEPNIIVMSASKKYLELLKPTLIHCLKSKDSISAEGAAAFEYSVNYYEVDIDGFKTNLVWGSSQNTPFMPFSNKREIGRDIISFYNIEQSSFKNEEEIDDELNLEEANEMLLTEDKRYIKRRGRNKPLNKKQFYQALRDWKQSNPLLTDNDSVGNSNVGVSPLIYVKVGELLYKLHSDARYKGVSEFLSNKENKWVGAENRRSITNDAEGKAIPGFYFYKVD